MSLTQTKLLTIALVGSPNAGKSTLINTLIGENISIVTHKIQTTRETIRGILNINNTQLIFIDTPGIFNTSEASRNLEKRIVKNAWQGLDQAEVVCIIFDGSHYKNKTPYFLNKLPKDKKYICLINKIDLIKDKSALLDIASDLDKLQIFDKIFMISGLRKSGTKDLISYLENSAHTSPWIFEEDMFTDASEKQLANEITRKNLYLELAEELPYSLKVETDKWVCTDDEITIYQSIHVAKASHKIIILGTKGQKIKEISTKSRKGIQSLLKKKIHLFLFVKVKEEWMDRL